MFGVFLAHSESVSSWRQTPNAKQEIKERRKRSLGVDTELARKQARCLGHKNKNQDHSIIFLRLHPMNTMAAHRRASLQFCGQATASSSSGNGTAFVHQLVSFDDEVDVLVDSAHSIAGCGDDDDDDQALRDAWSLLDDSDDAGGRRHPRRRQDECPPPIARDPASAAASPVWRRADVEDYYIVNPRVLGKGHQGTVRECADRSTGGRFAVKSMRKRDPDVDVRRVAREVEILRAAGRHRNIVRLVGAFEDGEYVHIVTELCRGGELFDRIKRKSADPENPAPCFAEGEAATVVHQILGAVSHMHGRGIAHRDIKPENVLFDAPDGGEGGGSASRVRIVDFGLSRTHDACRDGPMSSLVGTPYYIAPEVLLGRYDASCDLWSVGVVAYILLCGYPPFGGSDDIRTRELVLRGRYAFHAEDWGGVSGEAMDFVRGLLRSDPRRRMTARQALSHPWIVRHVYCAMNDMLD